MATAIDDFIKEFKAFEARNKELIEQKVAGMMPQEEFKKWVPHLEAIKKALDEWKLAKAIQMDEKGLLIVQEGKFAGLTPLGLAIARSILEGRRIGNPNRVSGETMEALIQARASLRRSVTRDQVFAWQERALRQFGMIGTTDMHSPASRRMQEALEIWRQDIFGQIVKAMDSTTVGSGDELVPTFEAAELWMDVNLRTAVLPLFTQQPMPTNPFDLSGQFGNTNWYPVDENTQVATTTPTTSKATLTAYEIKTGVPFSDNLEEDSIIALMPEIRSTLARNAAQVIDDMLLNADTTALNNISNDGVTTAKSTAGKAQYLIGFDGLRHLPYVDNTAQRIRVAGALANTTYNNLALKLGKHASPQTRGDVVYITPVNVAIKTMQLAQVETLEKYGPRATISAGEISSIYGTPLIWSAELGLVDTTGAVRNASANNTTGQILMVNTTQWRTGFRRQITFEPDREPGKGQTTLYVGFRIAFTERTGTRSTATHTALSYDISSVS